MTAAKEKRKDRPDLWLVNCDGLQFGPYSEQRLAAMIYAGRVKANDYAKREQDSNWRLIRNISSFHSALSGQPLPEPLAPKQPPAPSKAKKPPFFLGIFMLALNPGQLLKNYLQQYPWPFALLISGFAYMLFFVQSGLDLERVGFRGGFIFLSPPLVGFIYGSAGVTFFALIAWVLTVAIGNRHSPGFSIKAFGLGYAPALVYSICGIFANIYFGWNTALSFGIPGVLWAARPMMAVLREMTGGKKLFSFILTAVFGLILLAGWSALIR